MRKSFSHRKLLPLLLCMLFLLELHSVLADTLYDYYDTGDTATQVIYGAVWHSQTFTTNATYFISKVGLKLFRIGNPGTLTVGIRATSGGTPTGSDLTSGTLTGTSINLTYPGSWINITISSYQLQADTTYAIVVRAPSGSYPGNTAFWRVDSTGTYTGGSEYESSNSGASWINIATYDKMFRIYGGGYVFTIKGLYNEDTGLLYSNLTRRAVNVTAHFTDNHITETFEVNGTYNFATAYELEYFDFSINVWASNGSLTGTYHRQYWVSNEQSGATIYIFDTDVNTYTVNFLDLGGVLDDYPWVAAKRYINGTLMTVEKRKVDAENKILMNLKYAEKYTLVIEGTDFSYTYGELATGLTASITLTIRGIDFPKETLLTYKYVRVYGLRAFATPSGTITITYQDLLNMTASVVIDIDDANGTNVYSSTQTTNNFILSWASAANNTDYQVTATISHERYGVYTWRQYFPRTYSTNPWVLGWLGTAAFDINYLLAIFIVVAVGGTFSMLNPAIGAFLATCMAAALTVMGWLPLLPGSLLAAFCFSIMFGLVWAKRRMTYG